MITLYDQQGLTGEWSQIAKRDANIVCLEDQITELNALVQTKATCTWTLTANPDGEYWTAPCGLAWWFEDGGVADHVSYCPTCGHRIVVAETPEVEE